MQRNPIRVMVPGLSLKIDYTAANVIEPNAAGTFGTDGQNEAWQVVGTPSYSDGLFTYSTETDITGLIQGEQTLFPISYQANRWSNPEGAFVTGSSKAFMFDIIWISATEDIITNATDADLICANQYSLYDSKTFTELIGYSWSSFTSEGNVTTPSMVNTGNQTFGYLTPTAATRLFHRCYVRIRNLNAAGATFLMEFFPSMITIGQEVERESDLEYVMRLQRLANRDPL